MSDSSLSPEVHVALTHSPPLHQRTTGDGQPGSRRTDTPPPVLASATLASQHLSKLPYSPPTSSLLPSPQEREQPLTAAGWHRSYPRLSDPAHGFALESERAVTPLLLIEGATAEQRCMAELVERFLALLMPSTERLLRLRGALRGLLDSSATLPSPRSSPPLSPSQPRDLSVGSSPRLSVASELVQNPPRLCVTGVSDTAMDAVFQFLLHRDAASSASPVARADVLHSAGSAVVMAAAPRPPTPDLHWVSPLQGPAGSPVVVPRRSVRAEALLPLSSAASYSACAPGYEGGRASPSLFVGDDVAMTASVSGLLSASSVGSAVPHGEQVDDTLVTPQSDAFPSTPPLPPQPPPPQVNFTRPGASAVFQRGKHNPPGSPSHENFSLPTLHARSPSGILKQTAHTAPEPVAAVSMSSRLAEENSGVSPTKGRATYATVMRRPSASPPLPPTAGNALPHAYTLSPLPPLLMNGPYAESAGSSGAASTPPLPAAPANHNLRASRAAADSRVSAVSPKARVIDSTEQPEPRDAKAAAWDGGGDDAQEAERSADLSSTMPDVRTTPPPTVDETAVGAADAVACSPCAHTPPPPPLHGSAAVAPLRGSRGGSALPSFPTPPTEPSGSPQLRPVLGSGIGFRRRTAAHPSPTTAEIPDFGAAPTPMVTVLLHRTGSQFSVSSEHQQRSLLGNSPSPTTGRFNVLPTPFFSRVAGTTSNAGRSLRDDSTVLSAGSSFSPAAARFVQRLRRRTVIIAPAQLRFTAWDLFHEEGLSSDDVTLLRASRASASVATPPDRVCPPPKGVGGPRKRGSSASSVGGSRLPKRVSPRGSSARFSTLSATPAAAAVIPWMVGVSDEGVLRYERQPSVEAPPPYSQVPPIATTADYCLVCMPCTPAWGSAPAGTPTPRKEPTTGGGGGGAAHVEDGDSVLPPAVADTAEAMSEALDLFFGIFAPARQRQRPSAARATSILVTSDYTAAGAESGGTAAAAAAAPSETPPASPSSPLLSILASPTHEAVGTFVFPALGREESSSEAALHGSVRLWRKTPSFLQEPPGGPRDGGRASRGGRAESPPASRAAASPPTLLSRTRESPGESPLTSSLRPARESAAVVRWLSPLRQALVQRAVFVLVVLEPESIAPLREGKDEVGSSGGASISNTDGVPAAGSKESAVQAFVRFALSRYGVTVAPWQVVVFHYRDSVVTRNFLLAYYAHTHAHERGVHLPQQQQQQQQQWQRRVTETPQECLVGCERPFSGGAGERPPLRAAVTAHVRPGSPEEQQQGDGRGSPLSPFLATRGQGDTRRSQASLPTSPLTTSLLPAPPDGGSEAMGRLHQAAYGGQRGRGVASPSRLQLSGALFRDGGGVDGPDVDGGETPTDKDGVAGPGARGSVAGTSQLLFSLLTRDAVVPPLGACVAAFAPLMPPGEAAATAPRMAGAAAEDAAEQVGRARAVGGSGDGAEGVATAVANSPAAPSQLGSTRASVSEDAAAAVAAGAGGGGGGGDEGRGSHRSSASLSGDHDRLAAACTHALNVVWPSSGAASLSSAIRRFHDDAAAVRRRHVGFSLMAWAWQLRDLVPVVLRDTQLRCSRLRHTRRHAAHKLEVLEQSMQMHESCSPARSLAAMETRLQAEMGDVAQRFLHDVRRLLVGLPRMHSPPSSSAAVASTPSSSTPAAATASGSPRPRSHSTTPALDALRVYESPVLRDAYRRLGHAAQRFRDFYLDGHVWLEPDESSGGNSAAHREAPRDVLDGISGASVPLQGSAATGGSDAEHMVDRAGVTSLYEYKYGVLRSQLRLLLQEEKSSNKPSASAARPSMQSAPPSTVHNGTVRRPSRDKEEGGAEDEGCICLVANASASTRAASTSAVVAPPAASSAIATTAGGPRGAYSLPQPVPTLPFPGESREKDGEQVAMPRVDRTTPRERRVSRIASVASNASATVHRSGSSVTTMRSRPSLLEAATLVDRDASGAVEARRKSESLSLPLPVSPCLLTRKALQQRCALMERQLIAYASQLNTELINCFLATCVAALPSLQRRCVQAEMDRVRAAHATMYAAFTTAVRGRKEAAVAMANVYADLEGWSAEVGPLLTMIHSRSFLEKFMAQFRAVLCEDQIRGLAAWRRQQDSDEPRATTREVPLTGANLAKHCTAIAAAATTSAAAADGIAQGPAGTQAAEKGRQGSPTTEQERMAVAEVGDDAAPPPPATGAAPRPSRAERSEVGVRCARLLRYYTRLACQPPSSGLHARAHVSPSRSVVVDNDAFTPSSLRAARPTSAASTTASIASVSPRRLPPPLPRRNESFADTVSLTSMSGAWNRAEEEAAAPRSPGRRSTSPRRSQRAGVADAARSAATDGFSAAVLPPCMGAVEGQLLAALDANHATGGGRGEGGTRRAQTPGHATPLQAADLRDSAAAGAAAATTGLPESGADAVSAGPSANASRTGDSADRGGRGEGDTAGCESWWPSHLRAWRSSLSAAERPTDISAAPLLWLLLDCWDETLLRFPYGILLNLHSSRYAKALNALSVPVMESQRSYHRRFKDAMANTARQLTTLEADLQRLQDADGQISARYLDAIQSVFGDAVALTTLVDGEEETHQGSREV